MQTRLIRYFLALEREGHFGRAAQRCNVSQPTLSSGIAALEAQLGKRLVIRDRVFTGLTAEGLSILPWARQLIAAAEGLAQAAETANGPLQGEIRIGSIPAAMPAVGVLVEALIAAHPAINVSVRALTSRQIERALAEYDLDAGLTYLDFEPPTHALSVPLYVEKYMLVTHADSAFDPARPVAWEEIARLPLCLLHQGMQNRRILDGRLAARGMAVRPVVTADSYVALFSMVRQGRLSSVIPDSHAALLSPLDWVKVIPIADEGEGARIGLIVSDRGPLGRLSEAVLAICRTIDLSGALARAERPGR